MLIFHHNFFVKAQIIDSHMSALRILVAMFFFRLENNIFTFESFFAFGSVFDDFLTVTSM